MIVGYVAGRVTEGGRIDLYHKGVGKTPEEGAALLVVAQIEYPTLYTQDNTVVYELHRPAPADDF